MKSGCIKYTLLAVTAAMLSFPVAGQRIASFKERLSTSRDLSHATVHIKEYGSAADAVRKYDNASKPAKVNGYRVRIFFDNGQNARGQALATQTRFRNEFPGIPTYLVYENPSYMVTVGNCASIDEALMLWNRARNSFNTAFIWRGEIPMSEIMRQEAIPQNRADENNSADSLLIQ